jgi:stage V sporulation protein D (sporulation-specific penicillin-binding protein)
MNQQRTNTLLLTLYFSFFVIIGRLFYWQIIKGQELRLKNLSQTSKLEKIFPQEGHLLSTDNYPLSLDYHYYLASIYKPNLTTDFDTIINKINQIHPEFILENEKQIELFKKPNIKWVTFVSKFTQSEYNQIKIDGLSFEEKNSRFYPEKELAVNLIKNLENYYRRQIKGKVGFSFLSVDGTGRSILSKKNWQKPETDGDNLKLTINRQIQNILEQDLKEGIDQYQAESGSGIILKPETGEIIALASFPVSTESATEVFSISHLYEPGSIFKPLVMAMALDSQQINTDFVCQKCDQPRTFGQYTINNWDENFHPDSTLKDIIKNSDNIGMSFIIEKLGLPTFLKYFSNLKLDNKTGIDLIGESVSFSKKYWSEIDLATASFGQGFAINEIQMIQAFNVLANHGNMIDSHLKKDISPSVTNIFSKTTVENMIDILKYATNNGALAPIIPKNLDVCAKSGTAQIAIGGKYNENETIGSYIGFSPCENPKFTMLITLHKPKLSAWGSSTAAPIWFKIAEKITTLL